MEMGSLSWHASSITACRCSRGACPTIFLAAHSPGIGAHKSALTRQFLPRLSVARSWMEEETPLLHADHIHFSSVRPHWKPGYARGKSELDAFLRSLTVVQSSASILCCELFHSSVFSFDRLFSQSTIVLT